MGTAQALCFARAAKRLRGIRVEDHAGNASALQLAASLARIDARAPAGHPSILRALNPLAQQCFFKDSCKGGFLCPRPEAPCNRRGISVLSLADQDSCSCYLDLPLSSRGRLGVVHFIRHPLDIVASAYWYHSQHPAPEAWINATFSSVAAHMRGAGVPQRQLELLGLGEGHGEVPYGEELRSLPERLGVQLEFWRSAPGLYAMARQYRVLQRDGTALQVCYEDMQSSFSATWQAILHRFFPQDAAAILLEGQECDPWRWSSVQLAGSNHVTASKQGPGSKERLQAALAGQPEIRRHLCTLTHALGYSDPRCLRATE